MLYPAALFQLLRFGANRVSRLYRGILQESWRVVAGMRSGVSQFHSLGLRSSEKPKLKHKTLNPVLYSNSFINHSLRGEQPGIVLEHDSLMVVSAVLQIVTFVLHPADQVGKLLREGS